MTGQTGYRPYPALTTPFSMHMSWVDLLFMHWRVPVDALRPYIPLSLAIDTFDGSAWIAVVPFTMRNVRARYTPNLPRLSAFAELNVRTYVTLAGRPGVWFVSLDCENPLAVRTARRLFHLPYMDATMSVRRTGSLEPIVYHSRRTHAGAPPAELDARYQPLGDVFHAKNGTLEHFLTARYCLYAADAQGRIYRGEIDHPAWPLQCAQIELACNTMTSQIGLTLPDEPPHLLFSQQLDVVAWLPERVASLSNG